MPGTLPVLFTLATLVAVGVTVALPGSLLHAASTRQDSALPRSDLPFALHRGFLIVVEGQVGRMHGLTFILDTGVWRTVIDTRVARALGLRGTPSHLLAFTGGIASEEIVAPSIDLGPIRTTSPRVLAADLSGLATVQGIRAHGIAGADLLRGRCLQIDYKARRIVFERRGRWDASVPFDRESPSPVVNLVVDDATLRVMVDTGAEGLVLYEQAVPRSWTRRTLGHTVGSDVRGNLTLQTMRADWIWLGLTSWRQKRVYLMPGGDPVASFYDGVLGPLALDLTELQIDFGRGVLSWSYRP